MTYSAASPTLDSAGSYVMYGASITQRTISSISVGSSISPEAFLSSILLVMVIIVMVVIVAVILVVVMIVIVRVVIIVVFIGIVVVGVSSIFKPSFVIIGVPVGPVFLLGLLALAIDAACAFRAEEMPSLITLRGYDKDGDNDANGGNDDERGDKVGTIKL
ncbi:hypothetical protein Tco_1229456 [Tanacetum coccineum]